MARATAHPSGLHSDLTIEHSCLESSTCPNNNKISKKYAKYQFKKKLAGRTLLSPGLGCGGIIRKKYDNYLVS